jgi:hypothetical protein
VAIPPSRRPCPEPRNRHIVRIVRRIACSGVVWGRSP